MKNGTYGSELCAHVGGSILSPPKIGASFLFLRAVRGGELFRDDRYLFVVQLLDGLQRGLYVDCFPIFPGRRCHAHRRSNRQSIDRPRTVTLIRIQGTRVQRQGRIFSALYHTRTSLNGQRIFQGNRCRNVLRSNYRFVRFARQDNTRANVRAQRGVRGGVLAFRVF